jgi:23S rRNA G2445 N2-methylase RlmL
VKSEQSDDKISQELFNLGVLYEAFKELNKTIIQNTKRKKEKKTEIHCANNEHARVLFADKNSEQTGVKGQTTRRN